MKIPRIPHRKQQRNTKLFLLQQKRIKNSYKIKKKSDYNILKKIRNQNSQKYTAQF